uniref:Uncharacterized protein n=1 Tax=Physcomitrium patens TaxID=3218 RepID=A0A2K1IZX7_PHYPA|nr:hypothetical protein PHYPA_022717 [Physcomitrium patens]
MKFGSDSKRLQCTCGVATTLLFMVLCTLFTFGTVDFGVDTYPFNSQQKGLEWMFGSKSDVIAYSKSVPHSVSVAREAQHTWEGLNPPSQPPENVPTMELKEVYNVTQSTEMVHVAPAPLEEFIDSVEALNGDVDAVEAAPPSHVEYDSDFADASLDGDRLDSVKAEPFSEDSEQEFNASAINLDPNEDVVLETTVVSMGLKYDACLLVILGRRAQADRQALPYEELYRLFNAAKRPWKTLRDKKLLVGTDSPTIFCKMVRDSLGPAAACSNFNKFQVEKKHSPQCKLLIVGETKRYTQHPSLSLLRKSNLLWDSEEIVDLDVEDPERQPPLLPESQWRPTVVTTFSSNHVEVGLLLLRSLGRIAAQQNKYNISVVVWTMNDFPSVARRTLACVVPELQTLYKVPTEVREFDFSAWPSWMRINQKRAYNGGRGHTF